MFSTRWLYSIYTRIQINTDTKANTLHCMPHAFTAARLPRPPAAPASAPTPPSLLSSWQWIFCCFLPFLPLPALLGSLLSLQHFNIAATRQNVNVVHVYFLLLLCTFSCIFITRRQLVACLGAGPVPRCAAQCSALPPSPLILDSAYLQQQQHWESCVASGVARTQKDPESVSENIKTPHWRLLSTKWC